VKTSIPGIAYLVGGSVRDTLLGMTVEDRDWVVVGATPQQMVDAGFLQVGKDFPVYLHPHTKDEYALARTERKSGRGYHGFTVYAAPDVTLEDDLARRDLTMNAIAQATDGTLIDPYDGQGDLRRKVLRHVGPAFAEDPLRVLRLARFAARYADFTIAPETIALARTLADELSTLPAERVWQELSRGLMETAPERMFAALAACDAWRTVLTELPEENGSTAQFPAFFDVSLRYAAWVQRARSEAIHARLKVPVECADLAKLVSKLRTRLNEYPTAIVEQKLDTLLAGDAPRRPERLLNAVRVVDHLDGTYLLPTLQRDIDALAQVDAGAVARAVTPPEIPAALRAARLAALHAAKRYAG
jgi:tRNA nucleotidyltransferase (CCA-adding enzyme)